jgi:hypothetical protein
VSDMYFIDDVLKLYSVGIMHACGAKNEICRTEKLIVPQLVYQTTRVPYGNVANDTDQSQLL